MKWPGRRTVLQAVRRLLRRHPAIDAIVFECTNLPPYAADVASATGRLPVHTWPRLVHERWTRCRPSRPAMNLRFVEAFYWVVTLQSVTRAAEKLHLTQSAMSSRIASLEEELGTLLLDRRDKQFRLTVAGAALLRPRREAARTAARDQGRDRRRRGAAGDAARRRHRVGVALVADRLGAQLRTAGSRRWRSS